MQVFPIVSSSDGNCTFIKTESASLLIDCGISYRQLSKTIGRSQISSLDAVFITHEHFDHIKGLDTLARKEELPVYINPGSYMARTDHFRNIDNRVLIEASEITIGDLTVTPFNVVHDSLNTFGFNLRETNGPILCFLTDTGFISDEMKSHIAGADILLIECNYNEEMLRDFPEYPDLLKSRIAETHLSNRQTLDALEENDLTGFERIIMAHLSPRTNSPQQLSAEIFDRFPAQAEKFMIAPLKEPIVLERQSIEVLNQIKRS